VDKKKSYYIKHVFIKVKVKQSAPLPAWSGPESSRKLRFPDFMTKVQDGVKVVSLTRRPPLPPGNNLVLISVSG
jgi:hypothetical protein